MDEITKYVAEIGGPIAVLGAGMFFLLRSYVAKRIDSDFAERLESVKHTNITQIEHLRAEFGARLESLRSSLSVSQAAATLLLQKRVTAYEEICGRIHALRNALSSLQIAASSSKYAGVRGEKVGAFIEASSELQKYAATVIPFISPRVEQHLTGLTLALGKHGAKFFTDSMSPEEDEWRPFLEMQTHLEEVIREDLCLVLSDGTLTYPEMDIDKKF